MANMQLLCYFNSRNRLRPVGRAGGLDLSRCLSTVVTPLEEEEEEEEQEAWQPPPQERRFEDLDLHPKSLKALRRSGLHNLTEIQEKTFDLIVSGKDVARGGRKSRAPRRPPPAKRTTE